MNIRKEIVFSLTSFLLLASLFTFLVWVINDVVDELPTFETGFEGEEVIIGGDTLEIIKGDVFDRKFMLSDSTWVDMSHLEYLD